MKAEPHERFHPSPELSEYRRHQTRKRTMQGWSLAQIATELGVAERSVSRMRKDLKINDPRPTPLTADERARIEAMLDDGCAYAEIARTLGRGQSTIMCNYPKRSTFEMFGRHHNEMAKMLGLGVI